MVAMGHAWENPNFERHCRRRRLVLILAALPLAAAALFLLRPGDKTPPGAGQPAIRESARNESARDGRAGARVKAAAGEAAVVAAGSPPADASRVVSAVDPAARGTADALYSSGRFREARAAYLDLATDPSCRARAAICLARLNRWSESRAELEVAAAAQPENVEARRWLAMAYYRLNDLERALTEARAALALDEDPELRELAGRIGREIGLQANYEDAKTWHFTVQFDGREHDEIKRMALDILKEAYGDIGKEIGHFPDQPVTVILYTAKDFSDVTRAPEWAGGMFGQLDGKIRVPVRGAETHEQALRRVLFHEYTHALVYDLAPRCPFWLQEGLAQYFSGDEPAGVGQVIPLSALNNGFPAEARAAVVAYLESLQAVSDLVEERGLARLRQLLAGLGEGADLDTAFAAAYGQPFSRWAAEWRPARPGE